MACEREDLWFIPVAAVALLCDPLARAPAIFSRVCTGSSLTPTRATPPAAPGASRIDTFWLLPSKSLMPSLWISMNDTFRFTVTSFVSAAMSAKSVFMTLGITPSVAPPGSNAVPMVCVLPEPVWPYASTVALYPESSPLTRGSTHCSNSFFSVGPSHSVPG